MLIYAAGMALLMFAAAAQRSIGRGASALCEPGEGVMIDGGTTTLRMCPHLAGTGLQVLTNSLLKHVSRAGSSRRRSPAHRDATGTG